MLDALPADSLRRRRLIGLGVALALLTLSIVAYAAMTHRSGAPRTAPEEPAALSPSDHPSAVPSAQRVELLPVTATADPERFARYVAQALFDWKTASVITRQQHIQRLVAIGDPTGESSAGLVADVENYLPPSQAWPQLRQYETRQWIEIQSTEVPSLWEDAKAQAGPDGLLPGTTAYTIRGVRHRTGTWEGGPVSSAHDVAFTVFIVCEPAYPTCHLLRLSMLGRPLD